MNQDLISGNQKNKELKMIYIDDIVPEDKLDLLDDLLKKISDSEHFKTGVYAFIDTEGDADLTIEYIKNHPDADMSDILFRKVPELSRGFVPLKFYIFYRERSVILKENRAFQVQDCLFCSLPR